MTRDPAAPIKFVAVVGIVGILLASLAGGNPETVSGATIKVILWLAPGAIISGVVAEVASAIVDSLHPLIPAAITGAVWTALYWGLRLYVLVGQH